MPPESSQSDHGATPEGRSPFRRFMPWRNVLILLVALSLFQYVTDGEVSWHRDIIGKLGEMVGGYASRPEAGWRRAADQVEKLGARKEGDPIPGFHLEGRVVGVLDGDSIIVLDPDGDEHTVRLFGIDTPEKGQPHADVARATLSSLLARQSIGVVAQGRDQYGRLTGTVYLGERNINLIMVEGGHAWWYRRYAPDDRLLQTAERGAREDARGLWADPQPVPPWEWRRR